MTDPTTPTGRAGAHPPRPVGRPRRNHRTARDAGARFERQIANWLAQVLGDDRIDRRVKRGAHDRGDISGIRTILGERVVIECKDTTTLALSAWVREARIEAGNDDALIAVIIHKRKGVSSAAEQYVCMLTKDFVRLLGAQLEDD